MRWLELATFLPSPCPHFLLPLFAGFLSTQAGFLSLVWSLAASAPLLFSSWMSLLEAPFSLFCPHLHPGVHLASVSVAWLLPALLPSHTILDACMAQAEGPGMRGTGETGGPISWPLFPFLHSVGITWEVGPREEPSVMFWLERGEGRQGVDGGRLSGENGAGE